jgi:hypothetical protein
MPAMSPDLVDPVAEPVVCAQFGRVFVDDPAPLLRLLAPGQPAERVDVFLGPATAFAPQAFEQCRIFGDVVADEDRHLVRDFMRGGQRVLLGRER